MFLIISYCIINGDYFRLIRYGRYSDTDKLCQDGATPRIGVDICLFRWESEKVV